MMTYLPIAPKEIRDDPENQMLALVLGVDLSGSLSKDEERVAQRWNLAMAACDSFVQQYASELAPFMEQLVAGRAASAAEREPTDPALREPSATEVKAAYCVGVFRNQRDFYEDLLERQNVEAEADQGGAGKSAQHGRRAATRAAIRGLDEREAQIDDFMAGRTDGINMEPLRSAIDRGFSESISARFASSACKYKCTSDAGPEKCYRQCIAGNVMATNVSQCADVGFLSD